MYRLFKEIKVSRHRILLELKDGRSFEYNFPDKELVFKQDIGNQHIISSESHQSICILKDRICLFNSTGCMEYFQCPKEMFYYIEKDIRLKGEFSLEYRKHFRWKFDKRHVRVHFMPGCWKILQNKTHEIKAV